MRNPKLGLSMSVVSRHISHVHFDANITMCRISLGSMCVEYNNFHIKGKIVTLMGITHADYVKETTMGTKHVHFWLIISNNIKCCNKKNIFDFFIKKRDISHPSN